jgi:hypothetical protein
MLGKSRTKPLKDISLNMPEERIEMVLLANYASEGWNNW